MKPAPGQVGPRILRFLEKPVIAINTEKQEKKSDDSEGPERKRQKQSSENVGGM
jgi:hypothetical protein